MIIGWKTPLTALLGMVLLGATSPSGCGTGSKSAGSSSRDGNMPGPSGARPLDLKARLSSFKETPPIVTTGRGTFKAQVSADGTSIAYELTYDALEGVANGGAVTGAHIHIGHLNAAGGIAIPLCGGAGNPCPMPPADLTGTLTSADVPGLAAQGIGQGDLAEVIQAIRRGLTYANVHTTAFPSGEIRGQIIPGEPRAGEDEDEHEEDDSH